MRLIDADDISYVQAIDATDDLDYVRRYSIDRMPTIDAVPVVRCKDCKHNLHPGKPNTVCGLNIPIFDGNGYCSEGEWKDDA